MGRPFALPKAFITMGFSYVYIPVLGLFPVNDMQMPTARPPLSKVAKLSLWSQKMRTSLKCMQKKNVRVLFVKLNDIYIYW